MQKFLFIALLFKLVITNEQENNSTLTLNENNLKDLDSKNSTNIDDNLNDLYLKNFTNIEHNNQDDLTEELKILESENDEKDENIIESADDQSYNSTEDWDKIYSTEIESDEDGIEKLINSAENIDNRDVIKFEEKDKSLLDEWKNLTSNFEPAEMLTFSIDQNEKELIFDPISEVPSHIKLLFLVNGEQGKVDFQILDPDQKIIFEDYNKNHLFYEFNATIPGEYIFVIDNKKNEEETKVSFAIHQGNSTNTHLDHKNLDKLYNKIKIINQFAKSSRLTARMINKKYDYHYELVKKHNRNIVLFSLIETGLMMLIFFFQLFYIKRLANKVNL